MWGRSTRVQQESCLKKAVYFFVKLNPDFPPNILSQTLSDKKKKKTNFQTYS